MSEIDAELRPMSDLPDETSHDMPEVSGYRIPRGLDRMKPYICLACGAGAYDLKLHNGWHETLTTSAASGPGNAPRTHTS